MPVKSTTTGPDFYDELKAMLKYLSISLEKVVGISIISSMGWLDCCINILKTEESKNHLWTIL